MTAYTSLVVRLLFSLVLNAVPADGLMPRAQCFYALIAFEVIYTYITVFIVYVIWIIFVCLIPKAYSCEYKSREGLVRPKTYIEAYKTAKKS